MRFGAFIPQGWNLDLVGIPKDRHWPTMLDSARKLESLGFESAWVFDHFHTVPVATQEVTYEAWTLMGALAASTDTIRLGQMCTCNGYRSPAYLAKVAASIDVISGGRVEMGIGAGWFEKEFLGYGYEFPSPATRIGQLAEGVEIMRRMWTEEEVEYEGKYYTLKGAICQPKPVQQPHIPLWVAGGGEQLTLKVAARHADYTNFGNMKLDEFKHKSGVLADHCRKEGRDFEEIARSTNFRLVLGHTSSEVADKVEAIRSHYQDLVPAEQLETYIPFTTKMAMTPGQLIDELRAWGTEGLEYAIFFFSGAPYDDSSMDLFAKEVMPAFK